MKKTIAQTGRRSRFARLGSAVGGSAMGRGGSGVLVPPAVYSSLRAPGGYGRTAAALGAHTHAHNALTALLNDDHSQYLFAPRAKLRIVAPAGAPYTSPKTAIEACDAGDMVLILGGTYTLIAAVTFPADNIAVVGASRDATVLNFTTADANNCLNLNGKDGCRLCHFKIQAAAAKTGHGIYGDTCHDTLIDDVYVDGLASEGNPIILTGGNRNTVANCRVVTDSRWGIQLGDGDNNRIQFCDLIINGVSVAGYAVGIYVLGDHSHIVGNMVHGTGASLQVLCYVKNGVGVIFANNNIIADDPSGTIGIVRFRANGADLSDSQIAYNRIQGAGNAGYGIKLESDVGDVADNNLIAGNLVIDMATGIVLNDARVSETLVHGNHLQSCTNSVVDAGTNTTQADNT